MQRTTADPEPGSGLSRRSFLTRAAAFVGAHIGIGGLGLATAVPAHAATVSIAPNGKVICSASSCHGSCVSGSCSPVPLKELWYVYRNATGSTQTCSGTWQGPCSGNPPQCTGSKKWWMLWVYNKYCCSC